MPPQPGDDEKVGESDVTWGELFGRSKGGGMKTWIVIDGDNLCHRAFYALGPAGMSHEGAATGVLYGFLSDILYFEEFYRTPHILFAFDHGKGLRYQMCPGYKSKRKSKDRPPEEVEGLHEMRRQMKLLKFQYLHEAGFRNVHFQTGYEADDVIASLVKHSIPKDDEIRIVSSDRDLYQLLSPRCSIWSPSLKKETSYHSFKAEHAIEPKAWKWVKAIAGCTSDDIPGIKGIGEKSAVKYMRGDESMPQRYYDLIAKGMEFAKANLKLVKLPLEGCHQFPIEPDEVTGTKWRELCSMLGLKSLQRRLPRM